MKKSIYLKHIKIEDNDDYESELSNTSKTNNIVNYLFNKIIR